MRRYTLKKRKKYEKVNKNNTNQCDLNKAHILSSNNSNKI